MFNDIKLILLVSVFLNQSLTFHTINVNRLALYIIDLPKPQIGSIFAHILAYDIRRFQYK
jgi:hypothetical protein